MKDSKAVAVVMFGSNGSVLMGKNPNHKTSSKCRGKVGSATQIKSNFKLFWRWKGGAPRLHVHQTAEDTSTQQQSIFKLVWNGDHEMVKSFV